MGVLNSAFRSLLFASRDAKNAMGAGMEGSVGQNISATDALCEGPIYGLLKGQASLYLNDNPAVEAKYHGYAPYRAEAVTSGGEQAGTITFNNGTVGTVDNNTFIPASLTNYAGGPRRLFLKDINNPFSVTLSNYQINTNNYQIITLTGSGFTTDMNSNWGGGQAHLQVDNKEIRGFFQYTNSTTAQFFWPKMGPILDPDNVPTSATLIIGYAAYVTGINHTAGTITVATSFNGTFAFTLGGQHQYNFQEGTTGSNTFDPDTPVAKVDNLYVQEATGWLDQEPIKDIGGVGGSTVIQGSTNGINLPNLKFLNPSSATSNSVLLYDQLGMPNTADNDDYPGTPDYSDTNLDPTILNTSDFGLNTAAKINEADKVSFSIVYPQGIMITNQENGDKYTGYAFYDVRMELQLGGSSTWTPAGSIFGGLLKHKGKKSASLSFQHIVDLTPYRDQNFTNFRIKIFRVTRHIGLPVYSDGTHGRHTDKDKWIVQLASQVTTLQSFIEDTFSYPYTAIVNSTFSSRNFNSPPKRSYEIRGKLVQVPTAYTPRESSPTGKAVYGSFWDGTFKDELEYTDNPAWIFYDIVTNNRYGAGKWIKDTDIDKYALYRVSKFCDELVDTNEEIPATTAVRGEYYKITSTGNTDWNDAAKTSGVSYAVNSIVRIRKTPTGTGLVSRMEPRFRMNILLTKALPVYKVLKDMVSAFTSMLYWMDGKLTVVQDVPQDPVATFSKANVIEGRFSYESTSVKARPNQIIVNWNDPTINYELTPLIVEDNSDIIKQNKVITSEVVAYGCTSESQAIRYGKWKLWTAQNQNEVVHFSTSLEGNYIRPGDIINLQDADRKGISHSGRISSATSSSITADRQIPFTSGSSYEVHVVSTAPAAIYTGAANVTINGVTYTRGDVLPEAFNYTDANNNGILDTLTLTTLDTETVATNAFDANGIPLSVEWKPFITARGYEITNPGSTTNTFSLSGGATFAETPVAGATWGIKEIGAQGTSKLYKVLSVIKDDKNVFTISAAEHFNEKFVSVEEQYDLGVVPSNETAPEQEPDEVPPPIDLVVAPAGPGSFPDSKLLLTWSPPEDYSFVNGYEVATNGMGDITAFTQSDTFKTFEGVLPNRYKFFVRTLSLKGNKSDWVSVDYTAESPSVGSENAENTHGIPKWITSSERGVIIRQSTGTSAQKYSRTTSPHFFVAKTLYTDGHITFEYKWNNQTITTTTDNSGEVFKTEATGKTFKYVQGASEETITGSGDVSSIEYFKIASDNTVGDLGSEVFKFEKYPVDVASNRNPGDFVTINLESPNGSADLSTVVDNDPRELYVVFDESVPKVFLAEWDTTANGNTAAFWRDANDTMANAWTALTMTSATLAANSTKLEGVGTSFLSEVSIGDVISLANLSTLGETLGDAAIVTSVESNTVLRIDRNFQTAKNLTNLYVAAFRPDATKDAIVADISRPT